MTILAVTPNPALDRILSVPNFSAAAVNRATTRQLSPGGKGINVARAAINLGGDALALGLLAGANGRTLAALAEREGLPARWTWLDSGDTRMTTIITDNGKMTVVNENGDPVAPADWSRFLDEIEAAAQTAQAVCVCGSFPPGITPALVAAMLQRLVKLPAPVWMDSSGANLKTALNIKKIHLKINGDELSAALDMPIHDRESARIAAQAAHERTGGSVVVTLGAQGAIMVSDAGAFAAQPPDVQIINPIGSGDSALAALAVYGATAEGLRAGVAAGTANALTEQGGGHFSRKSFEEVLSQTQVFPI